MKAHTTYPIFNLSVYENEYCITYQYVLHEPFSASAKYSFNLPIVASNWCRSSWKKYPIELVSLTESECHIRTTFSTHSAFEFWWESGLKFDRCTIAIVSLYEHFHVRWLQCWCAGLCHFVGKFYYLSSSIKSFNYESDYILLLLMTFEAHTARKFFFATHTQAHTRRIPIFLINSVWSCVRPTI